MYGVGVSFVFKQKTAYEMRISDGISDVFSSDLRGSRRTSPRHHSGANRISNLQNPHVLNGSSLGGSGRVRYRPSCSGFCCIDAIGRLVCCPVSAQRDRKSVVSGQSVSVRVDLGVRRFIKKKKDTTHTIKKKN